MSNYLLYIYQNKKLISICFLLLFAAMPILAQPAGRILFNSDFEIPVLTPASASPPRQSCNPATACWYLTPESTVPGWNVVDAMTVSTDIINDNVELWNSGFNGGSGGVPAQSGNQFIELNADRPTPVFFEICMFAGETLTWSLWHRGRSGTDQMFLDVTDPSGINLLSQSISTGNTAWVNYTGMITNPTSNGVVRFTFRPGVTAGGNPTVGNFVDNIQILGLKPLVEFAQPTYSAIENAVSAPRLLVNGTIPIGGATVTIAVTSGTATGSGTDYTTLTTVTIPAGNYDGTVATSIPLNLSIVDDLLVESSETINFSIVTATDPLLVNDANCGGGIQSGTLYTIVDNDAILPVELVSFSAKTSENVELLWQTSSEKLSSYFEVQRSKDGYNWQSIGKIQTTNTNSLQNYSFIDKNPLFKGYYQLKMVDIDNSYKFSKIITVMFADHKNVESIVLYPNPVQRGEKLEISFPDTPDAIQIQIDDVLGRNHANYLLKTTNKTVAIAIPTTTGTYFITIFYNETAIRRKIVVQ